MSGTRGDGRGWEGSWSMRKQGLASVRAPAWRASTCSDNVVSVGYCLVGWTIRILLRHR